TFPPALHDALPISEPFQRPVDHVGAERLVADVAAAQQALAALPLDEIERFPGVVILVQIGNADRRPLACEQERHGTADTGIAPGDDRHLPVEPAAARIPRTIVRLGNHRVRSSRLAILVLWWPCGMVVHEDNPKN